MSNVFEIKKDVYYVGVEDKALEVFDIIMETEYGTTYNSYLIKDEKTVLFDTVKSNFKDEFFENIEKVTPIEDIDYIVVHHTEPDHASSLSYVLEKNPNAVVYCTTPAKNFLTNQLNKPFNVQTIKDGDVLNIGKRNIKFVTAPMLHWSDTMFTYIEEDKLLLTCDAFGCHYGSYEADSAVNNEDYLKAAKVYYDCIVKPFAADVLKGVDKVVKLGLDFDTILTSHGPILSKEPMAQVQRYVEWSKEAVAATNNDKMSIFYLSAYGNTKKMAEKIAEGAKSEGVEPDLYDLEKLTPQEMHDLFLASKVVVLGSPTINKTMVKPMWDLLSNVDAMANKGTIAGVFGSFGWSGEGVSIAEAALKAMGFKMPVETVKKRFFPDDETLQACVDAGKEYAKLLK